VQLIRELNELRTDEQKLKIQVKQVQSNIHSAGRIKGSISTSNEGFTQKRLRVQSAVIPRGREIAEAKQEKEEMDMDLKRLEIELA